MELERCFSQRPGSPRVAEARKTRNLRQAAQPALPARLARLKQAGRRAPPACLASCSEEPAVEMRDPRRSRWSPRPRSTSMRARISATRRSRWATALPAAVKPVCSTAAFSRAAARAGPRSKATTCALPKPVMLLPAMQHGRLPPVELFAQPSRQLRMQCPHGRESVRAANHPRELRRLLHQRRLRIVVVLQCLRLFRRLSSRRLRLESTHACDTNASEGPRISALRAPLPRRCRIFHLSRFRKRSHRQKCNRIVVGRVACAC